MLFWPRVEQILAGEKSELINENYNIRLEYERAKKESEERAAAKDKALEELKARLEAAKKTL
jgi:hypothetical protein